MATILVIEDEEPIRSELADWLQFEGYAVIEAANGRIGLQKFFQENPDLILCDITMPEMDGHEVLIEVRSNSPLRHTPFIFLTAAADREAVRKGMFLGADDYITKPFTHAEVMNAVESRLAMHMQQEAQIQNHVEVMEQALSKEREKHLLKSRLVAMFSHDFRNPLSSILNSSNILRRYDDRLTPERKAQHFDKIDGAVRLLAQMLDEMLMIAELEGGHLVCTPEKVDVSYLVESIVDETRLIDQNAHVMNFSSTVKTPVWTDPRLLRHIVSNLASNAAKYSPENSVIDVAVNVDDNTLELVVQDQGIGIPDDFLPHLFEPFQRAVNAKRAKGTGLGLTVVNEAVTAHGGTIEVHSTEGEGTRFRVLLPL